MKKLSAGILMFRRAAEGIEVFLVHPGGPLWAKKDAGAWSIPKGEYTAGDDPLEAAQREFAEEVGVRPEGKFLPLGAARQSSAKQVTVWAVEARGEIHLIRSNSFEMEWPPRSGRLQTFPEVDKAEWFGLDAAREKIVSGQTIFLDRLQSLLEQ